jgi:hypothetical protein
MADATEPEVVDEVEEKRPAQTPGQIIAAKSADVHKASSNEHVKVFVLPPGPKPTPENGYSHEANKAATIQYMLSQGMRPTGDVRHVSTKQHDNGVSWVLTYAVPAVPTGDVEGPSEPDVVTGGEDVAVNTSGKGHSSDTRPKADK